VDLLDALAFSWRHRRASLLHHLDSFKLELLAELRYAAGRSINFLIANLLFREFEILRKQNTHKIFA